jgi:hypothetical protein
MVYGRSNCVPSPPPRAGAPPAGAAGAAAPRGGRGAGGRGLALDCLYVHDKPAEGVNRPQARRARGRGS